MATKTKPAVATKKPETMPKTTAPAVHSPSTEIDTVSPELLKKMKAKEGGLSKKASDNLIPIIYLLQPLSPGVMKGNPARIEGAEAGDIWLRGAEPPIVSGEKGILFQSCHFYQEVVEWMPNRGGYAGRHDISCMPDPDNGKFDWTGTLKDDIDEVSRDPDDPNARLKFVRKSNGNEVVETRYYVGLAYPEVGQPMPYVIPLSSSGHTFGKQWMTLQNRQTLPDNSPVSASWSIIYHLWSKIRTNPKGSWYMYEVAKKRFATDAEFDLGTALHDSFISKEKKVDVGMMTRDPTEDSATPEMDDNEEGDM